MNSNPVESSAARSLGDRLLDYFHAFISLFRLPRAFWAINVTYALDGFAYFGIILLLKSFLTRDVGVSDSWSTVITGSFAACVTLFMFGFGSYAERFGVRKALIGSFVILVAGRILLSFAPHLHGPTAGWAILAAAVGLFIIAAGEGILQTANYSGLKQYSDEKSSAMGFGLNYAMFNIGIVFVGFLSPAIRVGVDHVRDAASSAPSTAPSFVPFGILKWFASFSHSGIEAVFWVCTAVTAITLLLALAWFTRRAESDKLRPENERKAVGLTLREQVFAPFVNARFTFFVFILFPARTMFAYQIHIFNEYIFRAYPKNIADRAEWFTDAANPIVVAISIPIITAFTRKTSMLKLMFIGSLVTALPTFLLCLSEHWGWLLTYLVIFSFGEALWQPRFYQFAAELAPEGKLASYMAAANIPWLLAKFITGLYSGWMLSVFCPATGPRQPGIMWAIYGAFALISPIGLWLARDWLKAGLHAKSVDPSRASA